MITIIPAGDLRHEEFRIFTGLLYQQISPLIIMKTILCISDFSQTSENAVHYAYELASLLKARLLLFHNVPEHAAAMAAPYEAGSHAALIEQLDERNEYVHKLEETRQRLAYNNPSSQARCEFLIRHGLAKDMLPALIEEEQVDLVVIGNDEADALPEIFTGTVAAGLIENASCPVLVIPEQAAFKPLQKMVVAVGQLGEPYQDLDAVLALALLFRSEVHLLHVLPKENAQANATAQEESYPLASWNAYKNVTYHVLIHDSIEEGISQFTRDNRADMLVLGYHAENPWQHLSQRNLAQDKAYHTYLPVLFAHFERQEP
ncbi:nucleotide-binding universal stress UspA family protein [Pontibacter ummariensis]|uniref:Nucleotide-binding universal stress protein, UspA family n=2 Tax=Pontibacter ummariensis TaxID=1610492 RepID=A0A239JXA1_9BACT|nr:nucleotide-binding universal stress UspA family protein [Pontibacter ummariensis]SNT10390.1 Nucleotide-binding universal stress protein, UspA family [Pontibacter ummariensis]